MMQGGQKMSHEKTLKHKPERQEDISQEQTWENRVLGRGISKCKGPEVGTHLICLKDSNIKNIYIFLLFINEGNFLLSSRINWKNDTSMRISEYWGEMQSMLIHPQCADNFSSLFWYRNILRTQWHLKMQIRIMSIFVFLLDLVLICFAVRISAEERSPEVFRLQLGEMRVYYQLAPTLSTRGSLFALTLMPSHCPGLWLSVHTLVLLTSSYLIHIQVRLEVPRYKHPGSRPQPARNKDG